MQKILWLAGVLASSLAVSSIHAETKHESAYQKPGASVRLDAQQAMQQPEGKPVRVSYRILTPYTSGQLRLNIFLDETAVSSSDLEAEYIFDLSTTSDPEVAFDLTPLQDGRTYINFHFDYGGLGRVLAEPIQFGKRTATHLRKSDVRGGALPLIQTRRQP